MLRTEQRNAILWQPVAYPSNYKKKEMAMFQKLMKTSDDFVVTLLRLALGAVFFAHGAQKVLGWFGGFGFPATPGFFSHHMQLPRCAAVFSLAAEIPRCVPLPTGFPLLR